MTRYGYDKVLLKRYKRQFLEYLEMNFIDNNEIVILGEAEDINQDPFRLGQMSALEAIRKEIKKELDKLERKGTL